jgi:hypothetical protein
MNSYDWLKQMKDPKVGHSGTLTLFFLYPADSEKRSHEKKKKKKKYIVIGIV